MKLSDGNGGIKNLYGTLKFHSTACVHSSVSDLPGWMAMARTIRWSPQRAARATTIRSAKPEMDE